MAQGVEPLAAGSPHDINDLEAARKTKRGRVKAVPVKRCHEGHMMPGGK
jgi:hypothetical protein